MNNKRYLIPNTVTLLSLVFGLIAILQSVEGRLFQQPEKFVVAAWLILISGICDFLDGFLARLTKTTSLFGMQFDSLCDLVAFGVAPALTIYNMCLYDYKTRGMIVAVGFVCCGAIRLARFNVMAINKADLKMSLGLPIPLAAAQLIAMILYFQHFNLSLNQQKNIFAAVIVYTSFAMVSNFEYVSNKMIPRTKEAKMFAGGAAVVLVLLLCLNFYATSFYSISAYCISGPVISMVKKINQIEALEAQKGLKQKKAKIC